MYVQGVNGQTAPIQSLWLVMPDGTRHKLPLSEAGNAVQLPMPETATVNSYNETYHIQPSPPAPNRHERRRDAKLSRRTALSRAARARP